MKTARILSIDGGGIRGLIPGEILALWEEKLGPIRDKFHMISGTSTGGILACGLAQGVPAKKLVEFYQKNGPAIFSVTYEALGGVAGNLYDAAPLERALSEVLHGNLSEVEKDLLITTYDLENRKPFLFKSWEARGYDVARGEKPLDFDVQHICRATSAAPTYFEPAQVKSTDGRTFTFIDGGVYANNPALAAYVAGRRLYPNATEYIIVSLGTGEVTKRYSFQEARNWGLVGWARPLLDIMFSGVSITVDYELDQLPGIRHYRFQTDLQGVNEDMDDASPGNMGKLVKAAQKTVTVNAPAVTEILSRLREPMTSVSVLGYPQRGRVLPSKKLVVPGKPVLEPIPKTVPAGTTVGVAVLGALAFGPLGAAIGAGLGYLGGLQLTKN